MAVDGNGNVFVVGSIYGAFAGQTPTGFTDIFVRKYNGSGVEQKWTRQFGTCGQSFARGVAVDGAGNVFIVGNDWRQWSPSRAEQCRAHRLLCT